MGEAALLVELGDEIDAGLNARVHALAAALPPLSGVIESVPGYTSLLVHFDPEQISANALRSHILRALENLGERILEHSRVIEIPTRYGGEFGPDLEFVAQHNQISPDEVIRRHTAQPFLVFMIGFAPGFPYLGILPREISAPRLDTPRAKIPAGSVGIAGRQTGIYPRESPGGWRVIGRTDVQLFDPNRDPPTLLAPGDLVRFIAI